MNKTFTQLLIIGGIVYLFLKQLPQTNTGYAGSPLVQPITNNLSSSALLGGAVSGIFAGLQKAISNSRIVGSVPATPSSISAAANQRPANANDQVQAAITQNAAASGILLNTFQQVAEEQGNSIVVPTLPPATAGTVPDPIAFTLPPSSQVTLASAIGTDLPISPYSGSSDQPIYADGFLDPVNDLALGG